MTWSLQRGSVLYLHSYRGATEKGVGTAFTELLTSSPKFLVIGTAVLSYSFSKKWADTIEKGISWKSRVSGCCLEIICSPRLIDCLEAEEKTRGGGEGIIRRKGRLGGISELKPQSRPIGEGTASYPGGGHLETDWRSRTPLSFFFLLTS